MEDARAIIWMVDDSKLDLELARHALAAHHELHTFRDGQAALERLAAETPIDLMIVDWEMPGMTGIELCEFVRRSHDAASLPILMLTVHDRGPDVVAGLRAGANDYVTKPYAPEELLARINALIHTRRLHQRIATVEAREQTSRLEILEQTNRAKDLFLATISHELRTPLTAILGWTQLLLKGTRTPEENARGLRIIERNVRAQARLIDDLLDFSRILSGKLRLEPKIVDLATLVAASVESARPEASRRGIELHFTMETAASLTGDPLRLAQVVGNLIGNAIKFTPAGGDVTVRIQPEAGGLSVSVADTGQGISAAFLPHVFDRFRQAESAMVRTHGGLGLGLAIARRIVEEHGGKITASSEGEGQGATFTFWLPEKTPLASHYRPTQPPLLDVIEPRLTGLRILIIEDEEDTRTLVAQILTEMGMLVSTASTVAQALDALAEHVPDVILSDIGLPGQSGLDFIAKLRALPAARSVPAIAVTAFAREEDAVASLRAGFDAFLTKPIALDELFKTIAQLAAARR